MLFKELNLLKLKLLKVIKKDGDEFSNPIKKLEKEVVGTFHVSTFDGKLEIENLIEKLELELKINKKEDEFEFLTKVFGLSEIEKMAFLMALSVEVDFSFGGIYSAINGSKTKKYPTVYLLKKILDLNGDEVFKLYDALNEKGILNRFFLKEEKKDIEFGLKELKVDRRLIDFMSKIEKVDLDLEKYHIQELNFYNKEENWDEMFTKKVVEKLKKNERNIIYIYGEEGNGKKYQISEVCKKINKKVLYFDFKKEKEESLKEDIVDKLIREAILLKSYICIFNPKAFDFKILKENIKLFGKTLFLTSKKLEVEILNLNNTRAFELNLKDTNSKKNIWNKLLKDEKIASKLSLRFNFTTSEMIEIFKRHKQFNSDIEQECYNQTSHSLKEKANELKSSHQLKDVIMPFENEQKIKAVMSHINNRYLVIKKWGFGEKLPYGIGTSVLFLGPPGTGKTMTAHAIANELNMQIYRVDLSRLISKYVGETEKNIAEVFDEASKTDVILFFDEADSIFGKRSEVKDAQDRYANLEVSYLLQKMEEYRGMSILATNYVSNIDDAFTRRINYIVEFPFPDVEARKKIWKEIYPKAAPLSFDIDYDYLAETFKLSGGSIKNIALVSSFLAADDKKDIDMKYIVRAIKYEILKTGKLLIKRDFGEYSYLIEE